MKDTFISVVNHDQYQHYKNRNPPWIKLHNTVLDDYRFGELPDSAKAHLMLLWLVASRMGNKIPNDVSWIGHKISATSKVNLDLLVSAGFITIHRDASNMLADCKQDASNMLEQSRVERETEGETETETDPPTPQGGGWRDGFEIFWSRYPRKIGKGAARASWDKIKGKSTEMLQVILDAIDQQKHSDQWTRDNGQFIPHPSTWLNQGRWDDEVQGAAPVSGPMAGGSSGMTADRQRELLAANLRRNEFRDVCQAHEAGLSRDEIVARFQYPAERVDEILAEYAGEDGSA